MTWYIKVSTRSLLYLSILFMAHNFLRSALIFAHNVESNNIYLINFKHNYVKSHQRWVWEKCNWKNYFSVGCSKILFSKKVSVLYLNSKKCIWITILLSTHKSTKLSNGWIKILLSHKILPTRKIGLIMHKLQMHYNCLRFWHFSYLESPSTILYLALMVNCWLKKTCPFL